MEYSFDGLIIHLTLCLVFHVIFTRVPDDHDSRGSLRTATSAYTESSLERWMSSFALQDLGIGRRKSTQHERLSLEEQDDHEEADELDHLHFADNDTNDSAPLIPQETTVVQNSWKKFSHIAEPSSAIRRINLGQSQPTDVKFPTNSISNAKYNAFTFLPLTLFEQFKFFFNLYFLFVALSQFIPVFKIGFLSTYVAPLAFVLFVTLGKEAIDDLTRRKRDSAANSEYYDVLGRAALTKSQDIKVGDIIKIQKDRRIPADVVLLRTEEDKGEAFIRTDQLDGETDWKLRVACSYTQKIDSESELMALKGHVTADPPNKSINHFLGTLTIAEESGSNTIPISVENTLWANTVLASSSHVLALVVYTGIETRQALNTSKARVKAGLLESEINNLSKILCILTFLLSFALVAFHGFGEKWYVDVMRFLILFSSIIPVSLRVNLDFGKSTYAYAIQHDESIPNTIVRTSTIPEDLGRIEYLLTDKTGTLTKNEMEMKKLHVGTVSYAGDAMEEITDFVAAQSFRQPTIPKRSRREISARVRDVVMALAVCHNVTPTFSFDGDTIAYQAASPDELAIVKWTASVGLTLIGRDRHLIKLRRGDNDFHSLQILHIFPFTSESKRMGIIVKDEEDVITFYQKGADAVMQNIVAANDWLEEECGNMAREGLRTLVVGRRVLSQSSYEAFKQAYDVASLSMSNRDEAMVTVVASRLEQNLELLGLTGVEDKLQDSIKPTLEFLRNAGIKIWMLTGDKVETARCIAVSAKLVSRGQYIHSVTRVVTEAQAMSELEFLQNKPDAALLIDGDSLQLYLDKYKKAFIELTTILPAVICCRCSPTQKADVARLIREYTCKRVLCIGDGGNDVSMIQAADVGVGIEGKEGQQASLAGDFSVPEFKYLMKLLIWHGRNSYKRSSKLAQFIIHRGLVISICQTVFSITSKFAPIALYQGWLMVGYATIYTAMPVFALCLDQDLDESLALLYPELYKELTEGKSLSYKTFFVWVAVSVYQGAAIMISTDLLHKNTGSQMVAISFTALIINELVMVALEVNTWHKYMVFSEISCVVLYIVTVPFLGDYFDLAYMAKPGFYWKTLIVATISLFPPAAFKYIRRKISPPNYAKVSGL